MSSLPFHVRLLKSIYRSNCQPNSFWMALSFISMRDKVVLQHTMIEEEPTVGETAPEGTEGGEGAAEEAAPEETGAEAG